MKKGAAALFVNLQSGSLFHKRFMKRCRSCRISIRMIGLRSNIPKFGIKRRIGSSSWLINPSIHCLRGKSGETNHDMMQYNSSNDVVALISSERKILIKPITFSPQPFIRHIVLVRPVLSRYVRSRLLPQQPRHNPSWFP